MKLAKIAAALLLFTSCLDRGESSDCRVRGPGVILEGSSDCDGFDAALGRAFTALKPFRTYRWDDIHNLLVVVHHTDSGAWMDQWGRRVAGLMWCGAGTIEVGTDNWRESALTHELVHLLECPDDNYEHVGWGDGCPGEGPGPHCIWESIDASNKIP